MLIVREDQEEETTVEEVEPGTVVQCSGRFCIVCRWNKVGNKFLVDLKSGIIIDTSYSSLCRVVKAKLTITT